MPRKRGPKAGRAATKPSHGKRPGSSKMAAWNQRSDIPLDDEEQFHLSRDKILLEGEEEGHDSDGDEEEVFALEGLSDSEDTDEQDAFGDEVEDDGSEDEGEITSSKTKPQKKKGKANAPDSSSQSSDSEEEEESWGKKKSAYYSSNMDQLDSDDEEANEMEEQEARRLQAKLRSTLTEQDFGLGDLSLQRSVDNDVADDFWQQPTEPQPKLTQVENSSDRISVLQHLQKTNPEALALALEWDDVVHSIVKSQRKIASLDTSTQDPSVLGMIHLHYQTQLMYASLLAFYLHLRSSEKYASKPETLRTHPIMRRLLTLKQGLAELEELDFNISDDDNESEFLEGSIDERADLWRSASKHGLDTSELADLLRTAHAPLTNGNGTETKTKKSKKEKSAKKKSTSTDSAMSKEPVYELVEPTFVKSKKASSTKAHVNDFYGEATSLDSADIADKTTRKKALRFHTSKIESASMRRQNARNALGGDDDIPYRERRKEQTAKAVRKDLGAGGDDLDDEEPEPKEKGKKRSRGDEESDGDGDGDEDEDGYYSLVKKQKAVKKAEKKAKYEAEAKAAKGIFEDDIADGQRSVTREIMANKGLTPKRAKSVRNPRVKKRMRFEKAKKKVSSQKAVYKGGISDVSRYGGEESGITKVVKSVRF